MNNIDILCLGVGKGASYVMKGISSTSFVILINGEPKLLIDAGAGVALSCLKYLDGIIPSTIYITHNHMDHTGDLPIMLNILSNLGGKPRVLGHADVLDIVKTYRMHDPTVNINQLAEWVAPQHDGLIDAGNGLEIRPIKTKHSYLCYGILLYYKGINILGYSADSPYDENLFREITKQPNAIIDARDYGTHDHSSFEEVQDFAKLVPDCSIWIVHYEQTRFIFTKSNIKLMYEGQLIRLHSDSSV